MHMKNDNNLKVVTHNSCLTQWLYSSIVCSPLKQINLIVTGNEATVHLVKRNCKFAMSWPPDQESVTIIPA